MNVIDDYEGKNRKETKLEKEFVILEEREEYPPSLEQITNIPNASNKSYITAENVITCIKVVGDIIVEINEIKCLVEGTCSRCGYKSHTRSMCYAIRDIYGRLLID